MGGWKVGRKLHIPEVETLEVGQYITVREMGRAKTCSAYNHGHYNGKKFRVLKCLEGFRIWRVK